MPTSVANGLASELLSVPMRLLSWNIYFGGHMFEERRDGLFAELERRRPDVALLQEVTPELLEALTVQSWISEYHLSDTDGGSLGRYGMLLLARLAPDRVRWLDLPTAMGRSLLVADVGGLTVATVHLESSKHDTAVRVAQLERIFGFLRRYDSDVVLAGDMNFQPSDSAETAALDGDFADLWPALRPGEPGYTVDTDANPMRYQLKEKPTHKRIDRVFHRGSAWRATAIELVGTRPIDVDGTFVSDHFGLEVELTRTVTG